MDCHPSPQASYCCSYSRDFTTFSSVVQVLFPPYDILRAWRGSAPLGAILVAGLDGGLSALSAALLVHRRTPWCPICLIDAHKMDPSVIATFAPFDNAIAVAQVSVGETLQDPARIVAAVRRRPRPAARTLSQYVVTRIKARPAMTALTDAFDPSAKETHLVPQRTLSRRISSLGPLSVRNWFGIGKVITLLADPMAQRCTSLERLANENEIDLRTLRHWLRLCTSLHFGETVQLAGWEWLLESALRQWGYVSGALEVNHTGS